MRDLLISLLAPLPPDFAVATSGGLDSCTLVAAAVAAGKRPRIVSFTFDDFESSDFKHARAVADHFDLDFEPVLLPSDQKEIIRTMESFNNNLQGGKKLVKSLEKQMPVSVLQAPATPAVIAATASGDDGPELLVGSAVSGGRVIRPVES